MAAEIRAPELRFKDYLPPLSVVSVYLVISRDSGLGRDLEEESTSRLLMKNVARFISAGIAIPFFFWLGAFYNTVCFATKGTFALLSVVVGRPLFGHTPNDYLYDMNEHVLTVVKDYAINFFIGFFCFGYLWDPMRIGRMDEYINDRINYLSRRIDIAN